MFSSNNTSMFPFLPTEIERIIWKKYYFKEVVKNIHFAKLIWKTPSDNLLNKTNDIGCYQPKYSDMEKYISINEYQSEQREKVIRCFHKGCSNCNNYGFPCVNATFYGNLNDKLMIKWKLDF